MTHLTGNAPGGLERVRLHLPVRVRLCVRARVRERVYVCVRVCERERESFWACVHVCVRVCGCEDDCRALSNLPHRLMIWTHTTVHGTQTKD